MFKQMKLRTYLLSVFSLVIVLAGIITAVGVFGLIHTSQNTSTLVDQLLAADTAVKTCRIEANTAASNLREMVLTDNKNDQQAMKNEINASIESISEQIEIFKKTHGESDGLAKKYEDSFNAWFKIATRAMNAVEQGDKETAKNIILQECSPALNEMVNIVKEIDQTTEQAKTVQQNDTLTMLGVFITACVITFVIALIFSIFVALYTTGSIVNAVNVIKTAVVELSNGNLKVHVDYDAQNEFGELAERMSFSLQELSKYVDAIDHRMDEFSKGNYACESSIQFIGDFSHIQTSIESFQKKINSTMLELETAAAQVSAGANQVADGAQALAQGATEQASSVEELSASIVEISQRITNTSEYAQNVNQLGKETGHVVENGQSEMKQLLSSIRDIALASQNIESIIKVIDDIAFQTNILALNAAVEAARAGTAGKGFAVVADEVRNLAQKSADAAKDTKVLIENSLDHVSQGEKIAMQTEVAFDNVANSANKILGMIEKIATASEEQAGAISQITQGLDQISAVVQTTSATSEQSAAASEELSSQAGLMKSLLDQFQLFESSHMVQTYAVPQNESTNNNHYEESVFANKY